MDKSKLMNEIDNYINETISVKMNEMKSDILSLFDKYTSDIEKVKGNSNETLRVTNHEKECCSHSEIDSIKKTLEEQSIQINKLHDIIKPISDSYYRMCERINILESILSIESFDDIISREKKKI